ncbi:MAG: hypothetical protein C4541_07285 [Candidatus Auribacter fodinae]|jgi:hypothetical protein|uniref:Uncharacterized protein n=1 Tax=Candidatus Auribacter fodinae TaxID=2093366 RepID=A0A3A4QY74_9BACT|nr:MAG: hypothetical protein C4541_07285 [Candidatus Auribacter fodinae]
MNSWERLEKYGNATIFRTIGGIVRPLPGCYDYPPPFINSYSRSRPTPFEDVCHKTTCRKCGAEIFYIEHNGGCLWVDELGLPWQKHSCFDNDRYEDPSWYIYFKNYAIHTSGESIFFGVIAEIEENILSCVILKVAGEGQSYIRIFIDKSKIRITPLRVLKRQMVLFNKQDKKVVFSSGITVPII